FKRPHHKRAANADPLYRPAGVEPLKRFAVHLYVRQFGHGLAELTVFEGNHPLLNSCCTMARKLNSVFETMLDLHQAMGRCGCWPTYPGQTVSMITPHTQSAHAVGCG